MFDDAGVELALALAGHDDAAAGALVATSHAADAALQGLHVGASAQHHLRSDVVTGEGADRVACDDFCELTSSLASRDQ